VGREPTERVNGGVDLDRLAVDHDSAGTADKSGPQTPLDLEPDKDHLDVGPPEMMLQVVDDPAPLAHPGAGDDHSHAAQVVQNARFVGRLCETELGECPIEAVVLEHLDRFLIQ